MDYGLKGKTAVITGGSAGIGAACVEAFVREGCNVVFNYHSRPEAAQRICSALEKYAPARAATIYADTSSPEDDNALFQYALKQFGQVDLLVNNAGIWLTAQLKDMDIRDYERTMDVNLKSAFLLSKLMVNHLLDTGRRGKIVNLTSQAAFSGSTSGHSHYAASKAGMVALTTSLAREMAPFGINVNAVAPGIVDTPLMAKKLREPGAAEKYISRIPLGRLASTEDIAKVILFLASNQSDYITGATIDVSGGMLMR